MADVTQDKPGIESDFQVSSLDNHIENGVIFNEIKNSRRGGWRWRGGKAGETSDGVVKAVSYTALESRTATWVGDKNLSLQMKVKAVVLGEIPCSKCMEQKKNLG